MKPARVANAGDGARFGVDVGGTRLKLALVAAGAVVRREVIELPPAARNPRALVAAIAEAVGLIHLAVAPNLPLDGVGLGVAGVLSPDARIVVESPNLPWLNGFALADAVAEAVGVRCAADNDAHCVGWGEATAGAGAGARRLVVLAIGTGLGGAIILHGQLMRGGRGRGAELGHLVVDRDGPRCGCGGYGCVEQYVSQTGLYRMMVEAGVTSAGEQPAVAVRRLLDAARGGDGVARSIVDVAGRALGVVVARLADTLDVDRFVIAGGIAAALDMIQPAADLTVAALAPGRKIELVVGTLGVDAGTLGAALLFDQHAHGASARGTAVARTR